MANPRVVAVGADKGGVGKTTVARTLMDYFRFKGVPVLGYDGQWPNGVLANFNPAEIVNLSTIDGQMTAFDGLSRCDTILLDLPAGMLSIMLDAMDAAKLLDEVRAGNIELDIFHIVGSNMASINEVGAISARAGTHVRYFLVKNYAQKDADFFAWEKDGHVKAVLDRYSDIVVTIPHLEGRIFEYIDKAGGTFESHAAGSWTWARGTVRGWLTEVFAEFDRVCLLGATGPAPAG